MNVYKYIKCETGIQLVLITFRFWLNGAHSVAAAAAAASAFVQLHKYHRLLLFYYCSFRDIQMVCAVLIVQTHCDSLHSPNGLNDFAFCHILFCSFHTKLIVFSLRWNVYDYTYSMYEYCCSFVWFVTWLGTFCGYAKEIHKFCIKVFHLKETFQLFLIAIRMVNDITM